MLRQAVEDNEFLFQNLCTFRRLSSHFARLLGKSRKESKLNDLLKQQEVAKLKEALQKLEIENIKLENRSNVLEQKLQMSVQVMLQEVKNQLYAHNQDQALIHQLAVENQHLRNLMQISLDCQKQVEIEERLKDEESKTFGGKEEQTRVDEASKDSEIGNALKRMIEKASQEIKNRGQKRQQNDNTLSTTSTQNQTSSSAHSNSNAPQSQDKKQVFDNPAKNIRPKKKFLLSTQASPRIDAQSDLSKSSEETVSDI